MTFAQRRGFTRKVRQICHSERSEESRIAKCKLVFDFRFLASLEMTEIMIAGDQMSTRPRRKQCLDAGFKKSYLMILANTNWPGFEPGMKDRGVRVLLCANPNRDNFAWYKDENAHLKELTPHRGSGNCKEVHVIHTLEDLFNEVACELPAGKNSL